MRLMRTAEATLWSTYHLHPGRVPDSLVLFATASGQPGQGKDTLLTIWDTNMREASRVSSGTAVNVTDACWEVWGKAAFDVESICMEAVASWKFLRCCFDIAPLSSFLHAPSYALVQMADPDAWRKLTEELGSWIIFRGGFSCADVPVGLPGGELFNVCVNFAEPFDIEDECMIRMLLCGKVSTAVPI